MSFEKVLKELQSEDVTWDDVRERRVFNRIREELAAPAVSTPRVPRFVPAAIGAVAAVFLIGLVGFWVFEDSGGSGVIGAPAVASLETPKSEQPSTMVIGDVGQVRLMEGAEVAITQQTRDTVKLLQTKGKAVYEIERRSGREVFVYAGDVEIRVVGTVFTVALNVDLVNVHVKKGFVRIKDGERLVQLRSGEEISVAARSGKNGSVDNSDSDYAEEGLDAGDAKGGGDAERPEVKNQKRGRPFSGRSTQQLFAEVDQARKDGNLNRAAKILDAIIARNDDRSSVVSALFILGKVERASHRHVKAAKAFSRCFKLGGKGPLAEDALAETAAAWSAAGQMDNARNTAQSYLRSYPKGIHAERMNKILQ